MCSLCKYKVAQKDNTEFEQWSALKPVSCLWDGLAVLTLVSCLGMRPFSLTPLPAPLSVPGQEKLLLMAGVSFLRLGMTSFLLCILLRGCISSLLIELL